MSLDYKMLHLSSRSTVFSHNLIQFNFLWKQTASFEEKKTVYFGVKSESPDINTTYMSPEYFKLPKLPSGSQYKRSKFAYNVPCNFNFSFIVAWANFSLSHCLKYMSPTSAFASVKLNRSNTWKYWRKIYLQQGNKFIAFSGTAELVISPVFGSTHQQTLESHCNGS